MLDRRIWVPSLDTGRVYSREKQADLKERINASGYVVVGKGQGYLVSHIIWIAAHGLPRTGYEIDHKNGNKRDNRLENLQEILRAANRQKALSSLSFEEADAIRAAVASGKTQTELASRYRVSRRTIYRVLRERVVDMDARTKARPATGAYPEQVREEIRRIGVDAVLSIIDEYDAGLSYWHIAKNWRVTIGTVKAIIAREMEARSDYTALCDDWYETTDNAAPCGEGCADAEDAATCGEGCADTENIVLCSNGGDSNEKAD